MASTAVVGAWQNRPRSSYSAKSKQDGSSAAPTAALNARRALERVLQPEKIERLVLENDQCRSSQFGEIDKLLLAELIEDARRMLSILRNSDSRQQVFKVSFT